MLRALISRSVPFQNTLLRCVHTSSLMRLKEIFVKQQGPNTTVIEAEYIKSPREPYLLKTNDKSNKCSLCKLQLDLKHTDVLILSQFVNSQGEILKRFETGLCKAQHKLVKELIHMAQHARLMPGPRKLEDFKPHEKFNTYYDETTIKVYPKPKKQVLRFKYLKLAPIERLRVRPLLGYTYRKKDFQ